MINLFTRNKTDKDFHNHSLWQCCVTNGLIFL
jgi:hypothetical protein